MVLQSLENQDIMLELTSNEIIAGNGRERFIIELKCNEKCFFKVLLYFWLILYSDCTINNPLKAGLNNTVLTFIRIKIYQAMISIAC